MKIFTNKDIRNFFITIFSIVTIITTILNVIIWIMYGELNIIIVLLSILLVFCLLSICYWYFQIDNKRIETATAQIYSYLLGKTTSRIDSNSEGSIYKLFHAINTLATTLDAQATKEQQMKEFLKDTISDISHQLKTPLAALNIYNELIQEELKNMPSIYHFTISSEKELRRMEILIQNLLKITKLDAGTIMMEKRRENVLEMMNDLVMSFKARTEIEEKNILLSGSSDTFILCDYVWLLEAISNLIKNALDHTNKGDTIKIEWMELPNTIQITIKDTGQGIPQEDLYYIFKRFYRSRFSKDKQGLGLGLSITKAIVESHDGMITVDSTSNVGSTFVLNFPILTKS